MPSWYRRECWKVLCDPPALEGSPYTCGRQTISRKDDRSIICPQDMSCSVCLIARRYEWGNRKCWKKSVAHSTPSGSSAQTRRVLNGWKCALGLSLWQAEWLAAALFPLPVTLSFRRHRLLTGPPSPQLQPRSPFTPHPSSFRRIQHQPGMSLNKISLSPRETVVRAHPIPGPARFIPLVQLFTCPCYVKARRVRLQLESEWTQGLHDCYLRSSPHLWIFLARYFLVGCQSLNYLVNNKSDSSSGQRNKNIFNNSS